MKYHFTISFLLIFFFGVSQQTIEICEWKPPITKTYSVVSDVPSNLTWYINGVIVPGQDLTVTWDSIGIYNISVVGVSLSGSCPSDTQKLVVNVIRCNDLIYYVPNSFTPDDDEHNQIFKPVFSSGFDPYDFKMTIYNRWGNVVWETKDYQIGWDGRYTKNGLKCQDGIYIWKIDFGVLGNDKRITEYGHLTIIK